MRAGVEQGPGSVEAVRREIFTMTDAIYIVREYGEEGQTTEHGIFTDPTKARHKARDVGEGLAPFSGVEVLSFKRVGDEFVEAQEGDPEWHQYSVEAGEPVGRRP